MYCLPEKDEALGGVSLGGERVNAVVLPAWPVLSPKRDIAPVWSFVSPVCSSLVDVVPASVGEKVR